MIDIRFSATEPDQAATISSPSERLAVPDCARSEADIEEIAALADRVEKRARLRITGWHVLRHTLCSHLAMKGAAPRAIQELAGHASISATEGCMHLAPGGPARHAIDRAARITATPLPSPYPLPRAGEGTQSAGRQVGDSA